jgi:hypothetical protein
MLRVRVVDDPEPALPNSVALKGYAIQVTDSAGAPVGDVAVALRLPDEGATGHFGAGHFGTPLRAWVIYTDAAGIARFPVIQWEGSVGLAELRVTAAKGTVHAGLLVEEQVGSGTAASVVPPAVPVAKVATVPKVALPPVPEISLETPKPSQALADTLPMPSSRTSAKLPKDIGKPVGTDSALSAPTLAPTPEPAVSISNSGTGAGSQGSNRKKWLVIAAIGAAAGIGGFLALSGHGGAASKTTSTGVTIGTPTISVSH